MGAATMENSIKFSQKIQLRGTWLAQSEECVTLDLRVMGSRFILGGMDCFSGNTSKVDNRIL